MTLILRPARMDEPKADNWLAGLRSKTVPTWFLQNTAEFAPVWDDEPTQVIARPRRKSRYLSRYRHQAQHRKPAPTWRERWGTFADWCYRTFIEARGGE